MEPPGLFDCKLCGERGALNKLKKFFGDPITKEGSGSYDPIIPSILQEAAEYYFLSLADNDGAYNYLIKERGLNVDTIEAHRLGWADGGLRQHLTEKGFHIRDMIKSGLVNNKGQDFLVNNITIPYFVQGNVVSIRGKQIGGKYLTPPGHKARLYNSDVTWKEPDRLIVTEGEFDCLVLEQLGFAAVGAPGAGTWQDAWTPYVKDIPRIYVCFDTDEAGKRGAEKLSTKLGAKIVHLPEPESGTLDVSDWVVEQGHTKEEFDMLLVKSKGGLLISVDEAYEEWLELEGNKELAGLQLGLKGIDTAIQPGLLPGQVVVIMAKTNAGKTVCLLNLFQRMAMADPDRKILFVSLEQTRNEWFERARRIYRFYNLDATEKDVLDFWRERLLLIDKNRVKEDELVSSIEQYEMDMGSKPDLVAVDYLGYWARSYRGEAYERTSKAIMEMKAIAKEYRIPFIAPHQVNRAAEAGEEPDLSSSRDSGAVEETADFLFALWSPDQRHGKRREERSGEVLMKILKSRHGSVGFQQKFQFAPLSLVMIPNGDPHFEMALSENQMALKGDTFDMAIQRHRTGDRGILNDWER